MEDITLSTGKIVTPREKKGQHHFIERRLLATCMSEGGQNIGGIMSTVTIQTVVGVAAVNGEKMDVPEGLAGVLELMSEFTYDEWNELETKIVA
ncbi:hypothetical protein L9W92_02175 [Pelotomaculum terephthalicicum JT]|uniref:hypothetical protein n=1 Tax=Pelotomaculum TaxID=191373 RepID=UPI0009CC9B4B|nr:MULTISPECIES: hypothetical protein [Pelotomaculum]MCG9966866.1 hypothetical protein [Pelotomaculum terephthalicicum JT]OPX87987.1 MAG: hypothetical protein A4E54_01429 [Pelotomaculum sp. PtaB.Bin117]OPY61399.1 MAG: hypothetical protein A4E56_02076 [Pelotomaculum sp. PtaU1.Bin065]